ncbi:MAG TPA: tetratricopeptide repeat protein [Methylococcaceae bacterium]|nr:tetratricopeptide repeat protein [Methylococcaceae bacterium]
MRPHAFVAMPFGTKPGPDRKPIDFNRVYVEYIKPALEDAGLEVFRADEETRAGDIRSDMFQELLISDLVIADLSIDNPNVWYELGVRHALRARGIVLIQAPRDKQPFDIYTDRKLHYSLKEGAPDPETLERDKAALAEMAKATLQSWHGRKISPVFNLLPNLEEPEWKRLRVGDAREFWAAHDDWAQRIDLARRKQRIGDILVLAEEAPVAAFRAEAAYTAGDALRKLEHFDLALEEFERCLDVEPDKLDAQLKKGICLQRLGRLDEARAHYREILDTRPSDPEVWALLGRVDKDAWVGAWRRPGNTPEQMQKDAGYEKALLRAAIAAYATAFEAAPAHYYSGINAIALMHLYRHLTAKDGYAADAEAMAGGVRWSARCEPHPNEQFWAKATLGDLEVLAGTEESVADAYQEAIACAEKDWFALNSTLAQLRLLNDLGFRPDCVAAGIATFERALQRLKPPESHWQPRQVLLFSGHMVDATDRPTPRFPLDKVPIVETEIAKALDKLGVGPEDLALTQGASGGDLIFAEACQARGVKLQLMQPFPEPDFIERSVAPAAGDWPSRFFAVKAKLEKERPPRCMPKELGESKRDPYERCNLWLLYTALAHGPEKVRFVCLWNGGGGDGPGGTQHMVREVKQRTGQVVWLDTRKLW